MDEIVKVELTMTKIKIRIPNEKWATYAQGLAGKYDNKILGEYVYSMSTQNLEKLFKVFDGKGAPKAVVVSGESCLQAMREKWRSYNGWKSQMRDIMKLERYPVEPNGKFVPYAHQTKIVGTMLAHPLCCIAADCGTGKTGSTARAVELVLAAGQVPRGKVLISAPLSILEASWISDIKQFTNLTYKLLWTTVTNKTKKLGTDVLIKDLGYAPSEYLTTKSKKGMRWIKGTEIKEGELDIFSKAEGGWTKMQVSWLPIARCSNAAATLESTPPLSPRMTFSWPTCARICSTA